MRDNEQEGEQLSLYGLGQEAGTSTPARAEIPFGLVNPTKNTRGYQEMCGAGFRVRGIRT